MTCSVVCVLRSGGDYTREHVRRLYVDVVRWWPLGQPLRFVALTDVPLGIVGVEERPFYTQNKGWWAKMDLFSAAQDDLGDILYFDLDTMVVGELNWITQVRSLHLLRDFYHHERVQSGMMYLPASRRPEAWAAFTEGPEAVIDRFRGDGEFLDLVWRGAADTWQDTFPGMVVSYKVDVRQRKGQTIPPLARVVCFHGKPRPWLTPLWTRDR